MMEDYNIEESLTEEMVPERLQDLAKSALVGHIESCKQRATDGRQVTEKKWIQSYRDFRGEYSSYQKALIDKLKQDYPTASDFFVKITKTKTNAAYGQLLDILFANNKFPIGVQPTPIPEGVADSVHLGQEEPEEEPDMYGFIGDGNELEPGATKVSLLGGLAEKLSKITGNSELNFVKGRGQQGTTTIHPANITAHNLEKQLLDQLTETASELSLRKCAWETTVLGTGCLKGPITTIKTVHKWEYTKDMEYPEYRPLNKLAPVVSSPSVWNIYPDPDACNVNEAEFIIERHLVGRSELRKWKKKPSFDASEIDEILRASPFYEKEYWELDLIDNTSSDNDNRYEVLEYWGYLDEDLASQLGIDFNQDDEIQINAFICNGRVIKCVKNPFTPQRLPYYLVPYEELAYQIWGVGIPENMSDSQGLINAHWRAAIDNLNLSGNVMFEVNMSRMAPGQNMTMRPGKAFKTQGGVIGQTIYPIKVADVSQSHMIALDKARQLADDETGMPSYAHGGGGLPSAARNASTVSMLLGGAALNIKTVIKNFDTYLLKPLGEALFQWNMQFNDSNPEIRGDYEIVAQGTASLLQREVKSQRLLTYSQVAGSNPVMAPRTDWEYIQKELAKTMDLDPEKVIASNEIAQLQAELMAMSSKATGEGGMPPGANPQDTQGSGGGNIGVGTPQNPASESFSGNMEQ